MVRKIVKVAGVLLLLVLIGSLVMYLIYNEPLPEAQQSSEADALAQKMLRSINQEAYEQTRFLEWSFAGGAHHYKWDKENGKVTVKWADYDTALNLNDISKSTVTENGRRLSGSETQDIAQKALDFFNNDSFWLVAPFKVFDTGTQRSIVQVEDGSKGLLVTYETGGTTPGDSYLWQLNQNGFPESYQMWVQIIPIGGIKATWDEWKVMENGLFLPTSHKIGPLTLDMGEVRAYN